MANEQKAYEMMVIFKPLLPDDVRKKSHSTIIDKIKDLGGKVENADVWGKRYLAYPVAGHDEGYYIVYSLTLPADSVKKLSDSVKRITEVLRHMIVEIEAWDESKQNVKKKVIEI